MTDDTRQTERERIEEALSTLRAAEPGEGFADRVMQAREEQAVNPAPDGRGSTFSRVSRVADHRGMKLAAALVAALCVVVGWHALSGEPGPVRGTIAGDQRQSVAIAHRGVAVAEPGAELDWRVAGSGAARIEQRRGNVFYRVERGGEFVVQTPRGEVRVQGTCFRVEIDQMKLSRERVKSAALGAAAATFVVITVYEGEVLLADDGAESVRVEAGEAAVMDRSGIRRTAGDHRGTEMSEESGTAAARPESMTREQLLALERQQRQEIARLKKRLSGSAAGASGQQGGPPDRLGPDGRPWFDPSEETLLDYAKECRVSYDVPPLSLEPGQMKLPDEIREGMSITDDELARMKQGMAKMIESYKLEIRALYIEATGDVQGADVLSASAMGQEIQAKSVPGEGGRIRQRIARERAGLARPPTDLSQLSVLERYFRLLGSAGDATEQAMAEVLGTQRARELRTEMGGWGRRMIYSGCGDEEDQDEN